MNFVLHILRHGKAEQDSPTGRDRDRALKPRGERQALWIGEQLARSDSPPSLLVSSPYTRARQTSEHFLEGFRAAIDQWKSRNPPPTPPRLIFDDRLEVGEDVSHALEVITENIRIAADSRGSLCLVGHNPQLELLIAALIRGIPPAPSPHPELRTGECYTLTLDDPDHPLTSTRLVRAHRLDDDD
ncbi:MAG TPA: phosphoglycerate mutase family protein [Phycisphaerales bacterium]|nr:phosphoglycerate mutase family protein [Phycisphaerales bacterium]